LASPELIRFTAASCGGAEEVVPLRVGQTARESMGNFQSVIIGNALRV